MGGESSDLVTHALGGYNGDLINDSLVSMEIEGEACVVFLHYGAGALLDGLGSDSLVLIAVLIVEKSEKRSTKI